MQNDLKYTVRSREIIDLVGAMKSSRLTLSPYFQRNLVWRDSHRRDFIDTILNGFPFPQIFLARGPIDVDTMESSQAVVDGQQRLNAIKDFVNGNLDLDGKYFKELHPAVRTEFLKYEVAVIDFDLDVGDKRLKDVFHRLNRTYYSLSAIEKISSEYSASEFLLVARALSGEILKEVSEDIDLEVGSEEGQDLLAANIFSRDPGIDDQLWSWIIDQSEGDFSNIIKTQPIFSSFEFDRKVPLMFLLNIMCTFMSGYYNRNDRVRKFLELYSSNFADKEKIIASLNSTANIILSMDLNPTSSWWNKANFFTLVVEISRSIGYAQIDPAALSTNLKEFSDNPPQPYTLAAREGVNGRAQRELRGEYIRSIIASSYQNI